MAGRPRVRDRRTSRGWSVLLLASVAALGGCGGEGPAAPDHDPPRLVVRAATSLTAPLTTCARTYRPARIRLSFGGSDELAAQIRQGAGGDLFAAANAALPRQLAAEGRVEQPEAFAGNELVLAVPARSPRVSSLDALSSTPGVRIAVGAPSVPVGAYTRSALDRLPAAQRSAIRDRVVTEEPDVGSVLAKLRQGVVDAAFVYRTDVRGTGGAVRPIALPARVRPAVVYEAAVVRGTALGAEARALLAGLRTGACARALRRAGFLPPDDGR